MGQQRQALQRTDVAAAAAAAARVDVAATKDVVVST